MKNIIVKIYGYLKPCSEDEAHRLRAALRALGEEADEVLRLDGNLLNISYEGSYFPVEDFLQEISGVLSPDRKGKIDCIDMEEWTLTRYSFDNGVIASAKRGLNDVLAFSGH